MSEISELTEQQLERAIPARLRKRLMQGRFESGEDIVALRRFVGLTQVDFARAIFDALEFYPAAGASVSGELESDGIRGRFLPLLEVSLSAADTTPSDPVAILD